MRMLRLASPLKRCALHIMEADEKSNQKVAYMRARMCPRVHVLHVCIV